MDLHPKWPLCFCVHMCICLCMCVCVCLSACMCAQHLTIMSSWNLPNCSNSCILSHTPGLKGRGVSVEAEASTSAMAACSQAIYQHSLGPSPLFSTVAEAQPDIHCSGWKYNDKSHSYPTCFVSLSKTSIQRVRKEAERERCTDTASRIISWHFNMLPK